MKLSAFIIVLLCMGLVFNCTDSSPKRDAIVGTWLGKQGAMIVFRTDSTFEVQKFPPSIAALPAGNMFISGSGTWWYKEDAEIVIQFYTAEPKQLTGFMNTLHIAKEGLLEKTLPVYLFFWEDVETGSKYKFYKQT